MRTNEYFGCAGLVFAILQISTVGAKLKSKTVKQNLRIIFRKLITDSIEGAGKSYI